MDNSLKDKVLESVDIVDVIGERVSLTRRGKEYLGLCPFHPDHRPSLNVSPTKQIFKCWSCGAGGDVIRFIEMYDRVDFREALATLARRAGIDLQTSAIDRRSNQMRESLLAAVAWARQHFQRNLRTTPAGQRALEYARGRGLTPETVERAGLGLATENRTDLFAAAQRASLRPDVLTQAGLVATGERGDAYDRFRNRLIFPIADIMGRPIAFGGRTLGDDRAKYLNSPETPLFSKSRVLYGLDLARREIEQQNAVIVVEGYMDAVLLHQYGFLNVVATLGTALTDAHAKLLKPRARTIYLCFDGDDAGIRAADRAVQVALRTQSDVRVVILDGGEDPADCVLAHGAEGFDACLKRSADALQFKWSQTLRSFDRATHSSRRAATEEFLQFVAGAACSGGIDPLEQNLLIGRLSDLLGTPTDAIFDLLRNAKRGVRRGDAGSAAAGGASAYELSVRGLPTGLVTTVETVLGLLLGYPVGWRCVNDDVPRAVAYSRTWEQLYRLLLEVREDIGEYSMGEVVSRCEDSALCELVGRATKRVACASADADEHAAAFDALSAELRLLRIGELREDLRRAGGDDAGVFERLHANCLAQDSPLPAEARWSLSASPASGDGRNV